jgi:Sec-independent protein secretion pathway component TatC
MIPLVVLFELSILLASAFGRPSADADTEVGDRLASAEGS